MNEIEAFIEHCFEQWSRCYGDERPKNGYPSRSQEAKLRDNGGALGGDGLRVEPENVYAAEAECWLILMRSHRRELYDVLTMHYKYSNASRSARELKISSAQFYKLISEGLSFVYGIVIAPELKLNYSTLKNYLLLYKRRA